MENFKHINLNETRRKLNNWRRKINSNTLNDGLVKKTVKPPPVESVTPSEISSLCSKDDIFKILQKNTILKKTNLKPKRIQPQLQQTVKSRPVIKIPPIAPKITKPTSPLVFLDIDKFKQKSYRNNLKKSNQPENIPKIKKPIQVKNTIKYNPILRKKKSKEMVEITKNEKILKINTRVKVKNNKKYLEETNRFSLQMIKKNLENKNIKTTKNIPEKLCRDIYLLCNLQV